MPRRQSEQQPRALVAAAKRVGLGDKRAVKVAVKQAARWQEDVYAFYDEVPEIKFGLMFLANAFAKLRLIAAVIPKDAPDDADPVPVNHPDAGITPELASAARAELARLRSSIGGQAAILSRLENNLEAVAECYLVGYGERPAVEADPSRGIAEVPAQAEDWNVRSISEVEAKGNGDVIIKSGPNDKAGRKLDPERDVCIRIWMPHARWLDKADCNMRAVLGEAKTLQVLSQQVMAEGMSHQSAGILLVPNELSFGSESGEPESAEDPDADPFIGELLAALTDPIEDPSSAASVMPLVVRGQAEHLTAFRHVTLGRDSAGNLDARIEARVDRIARGMNLPPEVLKGHQACVSTDTEILTASGWRRYDEVQVGDEVLTLNHDTGLSEWQRTTAVSVFDAHDQEMIGMEGRSHSSLSTLDHRWPIITQRGKRRWRESADLNTGARIIPAAPHGDFPAEAKWSDAFVEIVAWYWTEGSSIKTGSIVIYQSNTANPHHVASIRDALTRMAGPAVPSLHTSSRAKGRAMCSFPECGWPVHSNGVCGAHRQQRLAGIALRPVRRSYRPHPGFIDKSRPAWTETHTDGMVSFRLNKELADQVRTAAPGKAKVVTVDFLRSLTKAQLELFIQRSVDGDGWHTPQGQVQLHQSVKARTDAFSVACVLSGRGVTMPFTDGLGTAAPRHHVLTRRPTPMRVGFGIQHGVVRFTGQVWCPTVPNGTWLARRNGSVYFTGNTTFSNAAQIDQDTFEDFLEPRCNLVVDALTVGFLRPNLTESFPGDPDVERIVIWYDASALVAKPNVEANADAAHQRYTISDAAYRKAKGFTEDDAPEALEVLVRAALNRGALGDPTTVALLEQVASEAGVTLPDMADLISTGGQPAMRALAQLLAVRDRDTPNVITVPALTAARRKPMRRNVGRELMELDRDLRTRLLVAANDSMNRALERAGNRLRSKANGMREALRAVEPLRVGATLHAAGQLTAAASEEALADAWDELERQFMSWGSGAQKRALELASKVASGLTMRERESLGLRQAQDLTEAWGWMREALHSLAGERLFDPNPAAPPLGEFDPNLRVPPGLVRQAIARAGGAQGLVTDGEGGAWLALTDAGTRPAGGIGTGEFMRGVFRDEGVTVEGYVWEYGPAFRERPYEPHLELDGVEFLNFDDDVLVNTEDWPDTPFHVPGSHTGCLCDVAPILIAPADVE